MVIYFTGNSFDFPDPRFGEADGLVCVGGELTTGRLLDAYSKGFFPWTAFRYDVLPHWYCPLRRFVIFPHEIHVSHSMKQLLRQDKYDVTFNRDFAGVIRGCAHADGRYSEGAAWLGPNIIRAYTRLHRLGYAESVEVWERESGKLVGGLYGVTLRNAFFGESMFSLAPSASKLALIHLARTMQADGRLFIDCQFETPHLLSMGGRHISYGKYMEILDKQRLC